MTDAQLIYEACLRSEKKLEAWVASFDEPATKGLARIALTAVQTVRTEIGNGLASRGGPRGPIA